MVRIPHSHGSNAPLQVEGSGPLDRDHERLLHQVLGAVPVAEQMEADRDPGCDRRCDAGSSRNASWASPTPPVPCSSCWRRTGWLDPDDIAVRRRIVGFRNVDVHRYLDVDPRIVRAVLESNVEDLHRFVRRIRDHLAAG